MEEDGGWRSKVKRSNGEGCTSEKLLGEVQRVPETEVVIVEEGTDSALLLGRVVVRETGKKLRKMLPLGVRQNISPRTLTQH